MGHDGVSAVVTAVNAAALTPASVSNETSTSPLATPLVLTLRWHRLSRSLLRGSTKVAARATMIFGLAGHKSRRC